MAMNIEEIRRANDITHAEVGDWFLAMYDYQGKVTSGVAYEVTGMWNGYATIDDNNGERFRLHYEQAWLFEKQ